jgi:hypothetical protein
MRHHRATTLLSAVGASPQFVDDVIGDLEEIAVQRRDAAEPCGPMWYAGEVLRTLPYALRDSAQGSPAAAVVDVGQKALAAWLLLGMLTVTVGGITVFGYDAWRGSANDGRIWFPSDAFLVSLLLAGALRYVLLGYVTAWMDPKRPLITLLTVAVCEAVLHARYFGDDLTWPSSLLMAAVAWSLIMLGGVWRVFGTRAGHTQALQASTTRLAR